MALKLNNWDGSKFLTSKKAIKEYLKIVFEDKPEQGLLNLTIKDIAKARGGVTLFAREAGVKRSELIEATKLNGQINVDVMQKILKTFGLKLNVN